MKCLSMNIKVNENTSIIFDLDDTLYNEIDFLISAYKEIAKHLEPEDWKNLFVNMFSRYRQNLDVFEFLSKAYNTPKIDLINLYRLHFPNIKVKDGVLSVLQKIKNNKGKIGLITDGRSSTQNEKIKALKIQNYLDCIIISEESGFEKPHPNNFLLADSKLKSEVYYYIADNLKKDFITPNKLGWKTLGLIDNGLNIHSDSFKYVDDEYLPNDFIFSFNELNIL